MINIDDYTGDAGKFILLCDLDTTHYPLKVSEYSTMEGNDGFGINTSDGKKVILEFGSYGYDTYFPDEDTAKKTADFLNRMLQISFNH